jgi:serine/threonine protein kinase
MVMELCDGGDLFDFVINDQEENAVRDQSVVKDFFIQILGAVEHMHQQGVYHRDIKLENILLQQIEGDNDIDQLVCKVADFGLATRERYSMEFGCGSTSYLAPEHFVTSDATDLLPYDAAASDTWSLGILLLALMFGRNPWQESSADDAAYVEFKRNPSMLKEQLFPELSTAAFKLLKSALATNGSERISVAEFKQQFLAIDNLYDDEEELNEESITIPNNTTCKPNGQSFDSAFFSGNAMSWSDMAEEEDHTSCSNSTSSPLCNPYSEEEDDDMFIHNGEKESWWL